MEDHLVGAREMLAIIAYVLAIIYYSAGLLATAREVGPEKIRTSKSFALRAILVLFYLITTYYIGAIIIASGPLTFSGIRYENGELVARTVVPFHVERQRVSTFIVSPAGWQNSHIKVKAGQHLLFSAAGQVNLSLSRLVEIAQLRTRIEERRRKAGLPTDAFSPIELDSITPAKGYDWVGPDGVEKYVSATNPGRESTLALPQARYGALIGAISGPARSSRLPEATAFLIGSGRSLVVKDDGELWFNVNDVGYYPGKAPDYADIWHREDIGFYSVVMMISD